MRPPAVVSGGKCRRRSHTLPPAFEHVFASRVPFFDFFAPLMQNPSSTLHPLADFRHCPRCGSDAFAPHDEKSNRCPACGFTYYYNPAAATAALILNDRNELLVCRRAHDPARGTLDLPGGFCDVGETAEEGVTREVAEETGLRVLRTDYLFSLPNSYVFSGFPVATVDLFFRCRVAADDEARARDDASELLWIPLCALRPEAFGLASIQRGIRRFLDMR